MLNPKVFKVMYISCLRFNFGAAIIESSVLGMGVLVSRFFSSI